MCWKNDWYPDRPEWAERCCPMECGYLGCRRERCAGCPMRYHGYQETEEFEPFRKPRREEYMENRMWGREERVDSMDAKGTNDDEEERNGYAGYLDGLTPYGIRNQQGLQNRELVRKLTGQESNGIVQEKEPENYYEEDRENDRDRERLKSMYPEVAKDIMPYVEEECDRMEYEGSMMFDEYPDKRILSRISTRIFEQVKEKYDIEEREDKDETLAMNVEMRRRYPPGKNWLHDLIDVMFYEEIYRRRCRRRRCRNRW